MANARITQETIEVLRVEDSANARITQETIEVLRVEDSANARITQETIEVLRVDSGPLNKIQVAHQMEQTLSLPTTAQSANAVQVMHQMVQMLSKVPKKPLSQITIIT